MLRSMKPRVYSLCACSLIALFSFCFIAVSPDRIEEHVLPISMAEREKTCIAHVSQDKSACNRPLVSSVSMCVFEGRMLSKKVREFSMAAKGLLLGRTSSSSSVQAETARGRA